MRKHLQAFKWFGGKGRLVHRIIALMPPHRIYVEPFGGAATVLLNKPPSPVEVYNDVDEGLVGFFRVLSDPDLFAQFYRRVAVLPYSRKLYDDARRTWRDEPDPVKRAGTVVYRRAGSHSVAALTTHGDSSLHTL
ncbi:MAG: hypothetical protein KatS3mg059_1774 [Thermomicrobiales bacterium]|nr:MAG: hypothetical protein KatS3mg059_1774 [Thermomicrobiales bacterium]